MGQPVVHFEIVGKDADKLQSYYSELFGWEIDSNNPMRYGRSSVRGTRTPTGWASEAGSGRAPTAMRAT